MENDFELSRIHEGLCTPEFTIKLEPAAISLFHESIDWKNEAEIAPTLPVTFWQVSYPKWLSACPLPQILREQQVRYYESLRYGQEYVCRIECIQVTYIETKRGNTFLSLTHRLSGDLERRRVWDADTVLYIPASIPEGVVAKKVNSSLQQSKAPTDPKCEWEDLVTTDHIQRYAFASADTQAIHLDEKVARAAGYPHVMVHGMYGIGLALSRYTQKLLESETVQQFRVQFIGPLFAQETLCVAISLAEGATQLIGFEKGKGKRIFIAELEVGKKE